jgi:hypothetical protein
VEWIHDSQFAKSERTCLTAVLLKVLTYEYTRVNRRNGSSMDDDVKGCFDRIVSLLALIACQDLGASLTSCQKLGSAWHDMQHHVNLGSRVRNDTYPKDRNYNQYSAGKCSCLTPLLWFLTSTAIYNMLDNIPASLIMTMSVMEQDTQPPQYSVEGLTLLAQTTERALFVSGGELELSKCFWYLIQWIWESKHIPYMASSEE